MKICIPVSAFDAPRLPLLVDVILHFAGLQAHDILLVPTASATELANAQGDRLRTVCPKVDVAPMDHDPQWGWFTAPNIQWFHTVMHLHNVLKQRTGWFWMEVDCIPVKADWANTLAAEYMSQGKPFCGHVVETPFRTPDGQIAPTPPNDTMMMGCGIYPPGMPADELIGPLFMDLCKTPPYAADQPWDIYLRWVMKARGMAHTPLIGDMWNTGNYRRDGDVLMCDALPSKHPGRARGGVVPPECVVVHGCKDESLYRLVLTPTEPDAPPPPEPEIPLSPVGYNLDTPPPAENDPPGTYTLNPLVKRIRGFVERKFLVGGCTLKALSEHLKEPQDVLRPFLAEAGYVTKGSANWLGRKEEPK